MAVTMPLDWMKSICRWKMVGASESKPRIKPPWTWMPAAWMRPTSASRSRRRILVLVAGGEGGGIRRFDAYKQRGEARRREEGQQFRIVGHVDRRLGIEGQVAAAFLPVDEGGKEFGLEITLVAHQVVIDEEDRAFPAKARRRRSSAVTWTAVFRRGRWPNNAVTSQNSQSKGQPRGTLHRHGDISAQVRQLKPRQRRARDIGEFGGRVLPRRRTLPPNPPETAAASTRLH